VDSAVWIGVVELVCLALYLRDADLRELVPSRRASRSLPAAAGSSAERTAAR